MSAPGSLTSGGAGLPYTHTTIRVLVLGLVHVHDFIHFLLAGVSLINSIGFP